jgi:excinuclease ABC subunit C
MAEVVRRRYTRLLNESKVERRELRAEGGEAIPQELQKLVDETSKRVKQGKGRARSPSEPRRAADGAPYQNLPDLILIDGGKGQLNAACAELAKLGLGKVPVIGLAKEFEDIYRPGESGPLHLGLDHPAVKLLQRIRDESHRVANSYNAQLRIKRISESILDEFPSIGEKRKAALLKKFGSVQRLRTATVEQIAAVPGFGGKTAAELKAFLDARSSV